MFSLKTAVLVLPVFLVLAGCHSVLGTDEFKVSICAKDSTGPYHYDFTQELVKLCKDNEIPYKMDIFPRYGSDGSGALRAGTDTRVALVGPGVAASHGYERTHVEALDGVSKLLMNYIFR